MIRMKSHDAERRAEGNAAADQASAHGGGTGLGMRDKQLILHYRLYPKLVRGPVADETQQAFWV